jgi:hypothetical protein
MFVSSAIGLLQAFACSVYPGKKFPGIEQLPAFFGNSLKHSGGFIQLFTAPRLSSIIIEFRERLNIKSARKMLAKAETCCALNFRSVVMHKSGFQCLQRFGLAILPHSGLRQEDASPESVIGFIVKKVRFLAFLAQ